VQDDAPDLVLSDVMMPEIDGYELCEKIKADPDLRDTPVLLLTARAETEDAIEGLDCGADDYVSKPFDATELRQRIENHLAAREHLRDQYQQQVRLESMEIVVEEQHIPFLETVTETVEAHLGDPSFSVDRLAEAVALSRRQLTRRMKEALSQTPAAFIRARRLDQAKQLLADEAETVAEVAYAVGFRSPSAFSKAFQKHVGHPPSEHAEHTG
jgi:Response regulator containing a CheY-like receiver domain and an HD-GYP domain